MIFFNNYDFVAANKRTKYIRGLVPLHKEDKKVEPLSPREHQVALLVARGFSNKEVARELGITDGTVKLHVQKIFQKLSVRNRYGIAMAYLFGVRPVYSDPRDRKKPIIRLTSAEAPAAPIRRTLHAQVSKPPVSDP